MAYNWVMAVKTLSVYHLAGGSDMVANMVEYGNIRSVMPLYLQLALMSFMIGKEVPFSARRHATNGPHRVAGLVVLGVWKAMTGFMAVSLLWPKIRFDLDTWVCFCAGFAAWIVFVCLDGYVIRRFPRASSKDRARADQNWVEDWLEWIDRVDYWDGV